MILDHIVAHKREEVDERKQSTTLSDLMVRALDMPATLSLAQALRGPGVGLIAELKKASPSKGVLCQDYHPAKTAAIYEESGASAISVLTDGPYFGGSLDDLIRVKQTVGLPVLRKDFVIDIYQLYEARVAGADAVLLICAILTDDELASFHQLASELDLSCLVEVHDAAETVRAVASGAQIIGINNRDLQTMKVDRATTDHLRPLIPADRIVVSESGIKAEADVTHLREINVHGMLVGETLMTAKNTAQMVRKLVAAGRA